MSRSLVRPVAGTPSSVAIESPTLPVLQRSVDAIRRRIAFLMEVDTEKVSEAALKRDWSCRGRHRGSLKE